MAEATRITVGKNDEATVVAEQLIDADTETIIFVIPKGSVFAGSLNNFKLLKREGSVLGKEIIIESDDPVVQEKAVKAGLEIGESFAGANEVASAPAGEPGRLPRGRSLRVKTSSIEDEEPVRRIARVKKKNPPVEAEDVVDAEVEEPQEFVEKPSRGEPSRPARHAGGFWTKKRIAVSLISGVVAVSIFYTAFFVLPEATVTVEVKKDSWTFSGPVVIDKAVAKIDPIAAKIPGQVFTQKNVVTTTMPATGKKFVEKRAAGILTVYNAYSSQPQNIVANTRFMTPTGIIFRISKPLTIPGAQINDGNIIPSSVDVAVVADKAGESGNVLAGTRLSIPGFAKTPKAMGFYGEFKNGATGGFSGTTKVATDADVKAAKAAGSREAEQSVRTQMVGQIPADFKTIENATRFSLIKQTVETVAGIDGNFSVTTEAQLAVFAYREQDLKDLIAAKLRGEKGSELKVDTDQLKYGAITQSASGLASGRVTFPVSYSAALSHVLDVDALRLSIAGQTEDSLNVKILGVNGVTGGKVALWPFYVQSVPSDLSKIKIVVE